MRSKVRFSIRLFDVIPSPVSLKKELGGCDVLSLAIKMAVLLLLLAFQVELSFGQRSSATLPLSGCGAYNCPPSPRAPTQLTGSDCLAFLRLGDVYVECGGAIHRITATRDVVSFSVGDDSVALIRQAPDLNESLQLLIPPYKKTRELRTRVAGHLENTCGDQLLFEVNGGKVSISNLATSKSLTFDNAEDVRCADDSSVYHHAARAFRWSASLAIGVDPNSYRLGNHIGSLCLV